MTNEELLKEILKHPFFKNNLNFKDDFLKDVKLNKRYSVPIIDVLIIFISNTLENEESLVSSYRRIKNYFKI